MMLEDDHRLSGKVPDTGKKFDPSGHCHSLTDDEGMPSHSLSDALSVGT